MPAPTPGTARSTQAEATRKSAGVPCRPAAPPTSIVIATKPLFHGELNRRESNSCQPLRGGAAQQAAPAGTHGVRRRSKGECSSEAPRASGARCCRALPRTRAFRRTSPRHVAPDGARAQRGGPHACMPLLPCRHMHSLPWVVHVSLVGGLLSTARCGGLRRCVRRLGGLGLGPGNCSSKVLVVWLALPFVGLEHRERGRLASGQEPRQAPRHVDLLVGVLISDGTAPRRAPRTRTGPARARAVGGRRAAQERERERERERASRGARGCGPLRCVVRRRGKR